MRSPLAAASAAGLYPESVCTCLKLSFPWITWPVGDATVVLKQAHFWYAGNPLVASLSAWLEPSQIWAASKTFLLDIPPLPLSILGSDPHCSLTAILASTGSVPFFPYRSWPTNPVAFLVLYIGTLPLGGSEVTHHGPEKDG